MKDATILKTGIVGSIIAAICCATPVLVLALGMLGLSAWVGGLDYVLLPALAVFLGVTAYGLWRRNRAAACCDTNIETNKERA
jgi:mercuric ion transport protein